MASQLHRLPPVPETLAGDGPQGEISVPGASCPPGSCPPPVVPIPAGLLPSISGKVLETPAYAGEEIPWVVGAVRPRKYREASPRAPCAGLGNPS